MLSPYAVSQRGAKDIRTSRGTLFVMPDPRTIFYVALVGVWIVGCDPAPPIAATLPTTAPVRVPALSLVKVNGIVLSVPAPFLRVIDRGTVVDVEISSEPFATTRPATQVAPETTAGYHFKLTVPVASIDDLGSAEWTQTLSQFPEDSADGFFVDDGRVQIVPASARASFEINGRSLTVHLTGRCFRRTDEPGTTTDLVEVDATFVAMPVTE